MSIVIGLIGLKSSGKSTLANAISGKLLFDVRPTKKICIVGNIKRFENVENITIMENKKIFTDDGVEVTIVDFPGMDDEKTLNEFNKPTLDYIHKCDVVVWVSSISTAFTKPHELKEFNKVRCVIDDYQNDTGNLIQVSINLSKSDQISYFNLHSDSLLVDSVADNSNVNTMERINNMFLNRGYNIEMSNAIGMINYHDGISSRLKNVYSKVSNPVNIEFNMMWGIKDIEYRRDILKLKTLLINAIYKIDELSITNYRQIKEELFQECCLREIEHDELLHYNKFNNIVEMKTLREFISGMNDAMQKIFIEFLLIDNYREVNKFNKKYNFNFRTGKSLHQYIISRCTRSYTMNIDNLNLVNTYRFQYSILESYYDKNDFKMFKLFLSCGDKHNRSTMVDVRYPFKFIDKFTERKFIYFEYAMPYDIHHNFKYDYDIFINNKVTITLKWQNEVLNIRKLLYPNENPLNIETLIRFVKDLHMFSLFSYIKNDYTN